MSNRKTALACSFVKWLSLVMVFAIPVIVTGYWVSPAGMPFLSHQAVSIFSDPAALSIGERFAGFMVDIIPTTFLCAGLWQVSRLAGALKAGKFFDAPTISRLHTAGILFILFAIANVIDRALLSVILTIQNPPGERMLALTLELSDIGFLLFGVLFLVLISVFAEGQKQREDLSEIV